MDEAGVGAIAPGERRVFGSERRLQRHTALSAAEHRRLRRRRRIARNLTAWAFLAPFAVFFVLFLLLPVVGVVWWSLHDGALTGGSEFVGLKNFQRIIGSLEASATVYNTVAFAVMSVPVIIAAALGVAVLLGRVRRGAAAYRFFIYFPVLVPPVVVGLIWIFLTHADFGLFNLLLQAAGQEPRVWLGPDLALAMVATADIWRNIGYWAIFLLAALIGLPRELYEAAHLDGANAWGRFRYVTIPGIKRVLLLAVVMASIWALQVFDVVMILTKGGPGTSTTTAVYFVWWYVFSKNKIGLAAAISVLLLLAIGALSLILIRLLRERRAA
jgi:ABC-type sugar transport system permease subunit